MPFPEAEISAKDETFVPGCLVREIVGRGQNEGGGVRAG